MADARINVARLECWHANEIIYQADGRTDDGRHVFVHYRRPRFSVWVGDGPYETTEGIEVFSSVHPDYDPSTINRATLAAWTAASIPAIAWPERIDGYANEPEGAEGQG